MGHGTRVGEGQAEVVTRKNFIVRLEGPRFFVEKDEVVLSAIVHNYLKTTKQVNVSSGVRWRLLDLAKRFIPAGRSAQRRRHPRRLAGESRATKARPPSA